MQSIKPILTEGMTVVCHDNLGAESLLTLHSRYVVREVNHRGAFIKIQGNKNSFAASRFMPVASAPTNPMELSNASGQ